MKKLLLSIFSIFFWLISFSVADNYSLICPNLWGWNNDGYYEVSNWDSFIVSWWIFFYNNSCWAISFYSDCSSLVEEDLEGTFIYFPWSTTLYVCASDPVCSDNSFFSYELYNSCVLWSSFSSSSDITVFYDYWHSTTTVACNWDNSIFINWMASVSDLTTFTPFFNIFYVDEDNQNIIESYNKDMLYLSWWLYHKTYTWDNLWVLNVLNNWFNSSWWFNIISSWLVVSWDIVSGNLSWNIFKNFIDTWFAVLFSNVPSYIQYVVLIAILLLILRIFRRKKRI